METYHIFYLYKKNIRRVTEAIGDNRAAALQSGLVAHHMFSLNIYKYLFIHLRINKVLMRLTSVTVVSLVDKFHYLCLYLPRKFY